MKNNGYICKEFKFNPLKIRVMDNYHRFLNQELLELDRDPEAHGLKFHHVALRRGYVPVQNERGYLPDFYSGRFGSGIQRVCCNRGKYRPYSRNGYHYVEFYIYQ